MTSTCTRCQNRPGRVVSWKDPVVVRKSAYLCNECEPKSIGEYDNLDLYVIRDKMIANNRKDPEVQRHQQKTRRRWGKF